MKLRRSIRLKHYPYAQDGVYFVTICTLNRECLFGAIADGEADLSTLGCVADSCWWAISEHFRGVELDAFVVMPNHIHGIVIINRDYPVGARHVGARHAVPLQSQTESFGLPVSGSLPTIIRSYKSAVTRQINQIRQTPGAAVWQRNYYEHIVRSTRSLNCIRQYIHQNPARWRDDTYYLE
jgi:REP element-mobilizing transposase RayT